MQLQRLRIQNFRSIVEGEVLFSGHTVLIGGNGVGKSTVCEALDLLLGPDRLSRSSPIDEHDFHARRYLDDNNEPVSIKLECVLSGLTPELERQYRNHIEYWNTETGDLLDEAADPEAADGEAAIAVLRIAFRGVYDPDEDEFTAETYFASPPTEDAERRPRVTRQQDPALSVEQVRLRWLLLEAPMLSDHTVPQGPARHKRGRP